MICIGKQRPPTALAKSRVPSYFKGRRWGVALSRTVRAASERAGTRRRGAWTVRRS